jgi:histidine triad (HIT) family protein
MSDTIFSKILRGEIPCHKVYEDELVLAFLDVGPLSEGHTLVIPKEPAATLDALSDESSAAIGRALPRLCRAVKAATGCADYNVLQNNGAPAHQAVFHVHFHIIPKPDARQGLGVAWPAGSLGGPEGAALASLVRTALAVGLTAGSEEPSGSQPPPRGVSGSSRRVGTPRP